MSQPYYVLSYNILGMFYGINKDRITKDTRPINNLKQKPNNLTNIEWALYYTIQTAENWEKKNFISPSGTKFPFIILQHGIHSLCYLSRLCMPLRWCMPKCKTQYKCIVVVKT